MPIDLSYVGKKLSPVEYRYTERDVELYALGVGCGREDLAFTYEKDLKVLPTFAVIASFPAMMNLGGALRTALDRSRTAEIAAVVFVTDGRRNAGPQAAEIARLLKIRLAGHDVITPDISRPLSETGGVFNEVNTTPGLQHHYLIDYPERAVPVMERLIDVLLAEQDWLK